jgi:hypothetical protein
MTEHADYDPGDWRGHDFKQARKEYAKHAEHSYEEASKKRIVAQDLIPKSIQSTCSRLLILAGDVTGSMGKWLEPIFSKLGYIENERKEYLGEDSETCYCAIGDAHDDKYSLQVRPFASGLELKARMKELIIEKGGGGQGMESYELFALYMLHNLAAPNAKLTIIVIIGDEAPYSYVDPTQAKDYTYTDIGNRVSTKQVFEDLKRKCAVYFVRKPYNSCQNDEADKLILKTWVDLLGKDHIAHLPNEHRVVDVIFGILAKENGRIDYFREEIEGRQSPEQVQETYQALADIIPPPAKKSQATVETILEIPKTGKKAKPLL